MNLEKLTPTQEKALRYIEYSVHREGLAPTLREICEYMGYSAVGSAQDLVRALKRKGYLKSFERRAARSLIPSSMPVKPFELLESGLTVDGFSSKEAKRHTDCVSIGEAFAETIYLPILGQVPAGIPIEAHENHLGQFPLSLSLLPQPTPKVDELFVLKATGDSMIGAGILEGDWLVVKKSKTPEHGAIVVARVDGAVTVKRLVNDRKLSWCLQPENPQYQTLVGKEQPFELVGHVVALQRSIQRAIH